jgi:hypothetical protein
MRPNKATIWKILLAHRHSAAHMAETIWQLQMALWAMSWVAAALAVAVIVMGVR